MRSTRGTQYIAYLQADVLPSVEFESSRFVDGSVGTPVVPFSANTMQLRVPLVSSSYPYPRSVCSGGAPTYSHSFLVARQMNFGRSTGVYPYVHYFSSHFSDDPMRHESNIITTTGNQPSQAIFHDSNPSTPPISHFVWRSDQLLPG